MQGPARAHTLRLCKNINGGASCRCCRFRPPAVLVSGVPAGDGGIALPSPPNLIVVELVGVPLALVLLPTLRMLLFFAVQRR